MRDDRKRGGVITQPVIIEAVRTPIGKRKGWLTRWGPNDWSHE